MLSDDDDDNLVKSTDNFSVRYDKSNDIYYCFYHENEYFHSELILSYDVKTRRWSVETSEYQNVFEEKFNERFQHSNQTFEEQIELIRDGLDTYFSNIKVEHWISSIRIFQVINLNKGNLKLINKLNHLHGFETLVACIDLQVKICLQPNLEVSDL